MRRFPRRTSTRDRVLQVWAGFEDARWSAAQKGYVLTREKRLLGAVYSLTPLDGDTVILYDLGEVKDFLVHCQPP